MKKKRILMVCEAFGGGVFTYVSQLCNDMVDEFDVYLAYSLRPQTPKNYTDFLDQRVHLIHVEWKRDEENALHLHYTLPDGVAYENEEV